MKKSEEKNKIDNTSAVVDNHTPMMRQYLGNKI
jgi:hypothetical protein